MGRHLFFVFPEDSWGNRRPVHVVIHTVNIIPETHKGLFNPLWVSDYTQQIKKMRLTEVS